MISMNYGCSTSSWKPWRWVRLDLILKMRDIYINSNFNHSQNSLAAAIEAPEFKNILPWIISQMIITIIPISTRTVISYAMKLGIPFWVWQKVNGNWDNNMIRISQFRESHCRTHTGVKRYKKNPKEQDFECHSQRPE